MPRGLSLLLLSPLLFLMLAMPGVGEPRAARADGDRDSALAPPKEAELGHLEYRDPATDQPLRTLRIRRDDVIWAARMLDDEGGGTDPEHGAVLMWAMLQRGRCHSAVASSSLTAVFRSFSQPINPRWTCANTAADAPCRDYCEKGGPNAAAEALGQAHACSAHRLRERAEIQGRPWAKLSEGARRIALQFARGELANPMVGAVDWVANCAADRKAGSHKLASFRAGAGRTDTSCARVNSFYAENCDQGDNSAQWTGHEIRLVTPSGQASEITAENAREAAAKADQAITEVGTVTRAPIHPCPTGTAGAAPVPPVTPGSLPAPSPPSLPAPAPVSAP